MNSLRTDPFPRARTILPFAACALLAACQPAADDNTADDGAANEVELNMPIVPRPEPPMDRAAILTAVAQAASAAAAGADDSAEHRSLDGRPFEFAIRFGCRGPSPELREAMFGWTLDREEGTLRLRATPTISSDDAMVERVAGGEFEAVEGFWVPRPWLLDPSCPAAAAILPEPAEADAAADPADSAATGDREGQEVADPIDDEQESESPPPALPKVGIAQFFRDTDPRTGRRGSRPYETVKTLDPAQPISSQGFNLVISGRLRALPGGRVIACVSPGSDSPPDCMVSVRIDGVRLERPDTEELLAEWGSN